YQLHAQGNAGLVSWAPNGSLPAGMTLSPTGLVSITPQASGYAGFNFSLTDGQDTIYNSVNLNVSSIAIGPSVLPNATQNAPYTAAIAATGGTGGYTFSTNNIPSGLSLNSSTGVISGTVTSGPG